MRLHQEMKQLSLGSCRSLALGLNTKCPERVTPRDAGHFHTKTLSVFINLVVIFISSLSLSSSSQSPQEENQALEP